MTNLLINSGMEWSQEKGADSQSVVATSSVVFQSAVDQWTIDHKGSFVATAQQVADAPPGHANSYKFAVTTPQSSLGADDVLSFFQTIEGQRFSRLCFGTASAQSVTIVFGVRSHRTGQHGGVLKNVPGNRVYAFAYDVDAADVWEFKVIEIPGDTGGTWVTDNAWAAYVLLKYCIGKWVPSHPRRMGNSERCERNWV